MSESLPPSNATGNWLSSGKNVATLVYALQALLFVTGGVTHVVGVVVNYVKREDVAGTWIESHFRWQIRTFWWSLLWFVLGTVMLIIFIGKFVLLADAVWVIYRIVKGWLRLNDGKPMYVEPVTARDRRE